MHFFLITGPIAVGKMTVGQELSTALDIPLFTNHDSIELALKFGYYGSPIFATLNEGIRKLVFRSMSELKNASGMIFTLVWDFDMQEDWDYVNDLRSLFEEKGWQFYIVELTADIQTRLDRNGTPNRLQHKASKRDVPASNERLKLQEKAHRMNSKSAETIEGNHIKIDNSNLSPSQVVAEILDHFDLSKSEIG